MGRRKKGGLKKWWDKKIDRWADRYLYDLLKRRDRFVKAPPR
jgi:hypothetical protein